MMFIPRRLIFSQFFNEIIKSDPIVFVDAGARGGLEYPWSSIKEDSILVVGFEPDEFECNKLIALKKPNRVYIPAALWSSEGKVDIHLGREPSTSSIHPPNFEFIKQYKDCHWKPRVTKSVAKVNSITLDKVSKDKGLDCDFLKIDTQGAEFEILQGATRSITDNIFGVLAETWTTEVHKGQHLTGEILELMARLGFSLFDINIAAAWHRDCGRSGKLLRKRQITGLDLLFFREPACWSKSVNQKNKIIKAAAIADLFGFPDYAIQFLSAEAGRNNPEAKTFEAVAEYIRKYSAAQRIFYKDMMRLVYKILRVKDYDFPSLHY